MQNPSLQLAQDLTNIVNDSFDSGEMLEKVSPITRELLNFWFDENWSITRDINFHEGQKQAILNTIYLTEILKVSNVYDMYLKVQPDLVLEKSIGLSYLKTDRFNFPRYCYKMATGTGKTWVLSALLIWQYLNYKYYRDNGIDKFGTIFSSNFLIVAPGIIVYERLLDAFCGKIIGEKREFTKSDLYNFRELLIPDDYRDNIFSFVQSSIITKGEIGRKITGEGQIIITNRHIFLDKIEEDEENINPDPFKNIDKIIKDLLPASPGISAGNSLETLDNNLLGKQELEYLKSLKSLVVFNDEAHHLGEGNGKTEQEEEKKWQQAMIDIFKNKIGNFLQLDFTATPFIQTGKEKKYFPHIIVDFDIVKAMQQGLIKALVLDKRKEIASLSNDELEFKAIRNDNKEIISLSKGQEIMIQAGLKKLKILNESFTKDGKNKTPKMLIVCEDTMVVPFVEDYLTYLGYDNDEFVSIHSNKKGEIYDEDKKKVFGLDNGENPKIVISVLMLREGFDVNNICVIVPLRSSTSGILLEQTIGRGLRLMWRGDKALDEAKADNRKRLFIEKKAPNNYYDILSIVEHPAFQSFYEDLMKNGEIILGYDDEELEDREEKITGEIETLYLKPDYKNYDIAFPIIINDSEEVLKKPEYSIEKLQKYPGNYNELKKLVGTKERFIQEAVLSGTRFGDYDVDIGIMTADSYNDYLAKLTRKVADAIGGGQVDIKKNSKNYNLMQVNLPLITKLIDNYIHNKLFGLVFEPLIDNNWRILMVDDISKFIIKELIKVIEESKEVEIIGEIEIIEKYISEIETIKVREEFSLKVSKSIFEKLPFPSNKGGLEKAFIQFVNNDSLAESFCKIFEFKHLFFRMRYIREDGIPSYYYPDFVVKTSEKVYIVETKANRDINNENVRRKEASTISQLQKINDLPESLRENKTWEYVLLSEDKFYSLVKNNANIIEILENSKILDLKTKGNQVAIF